MSSRDRANRTSPPPRPLMPRLPASTTSLKSSPAPRLAASISKASPKGVQEPTRSSSTPNVGSPRLRVAANDATPVKSIVSNGNITPRSSARRSKIGSGNSTPTQISADTGPVFSPSSYKPSGLGRGSPAQSPRSAISEKTESEVNSRDGHFSGFAPMSPSNRPFIASARTRETSPSRPSELGPSFFRAGDGPPQDTPLRPALQKKTPSFVYADGRRETTWGEYEDSQSIRSPHSAASIAQTVSSLPGVNIGETLSQNPVASSFVSSDIPTHSTVSVARPQGLAAIATRSPSPPKFDMHLSYRKGASQIIRPPASGSTSPSLSDLANHRDHRRRQSSLDTIAEPREEITNRRPSLLGSGESLDHSNNKPPLTSFTTLAPQTTPIQPEIQTGNPHSNSSFPYVVPSPRKIPDNGSSPSPVHNSQESFAANARKERKVLDLEISNSSLLAINRSLEREMRKQKAELRRLRRFTRNTARTSWLSDDTSVSLMPSLDELAGFEGDMDDDIDDIGSDDMSDLASTTLSEGTMSPSLLAQRDAAHLKADRGRLMFDLSKHRELLADSQRMNLSLKRCLGITEQLLKDGSKALEHQVNASEVKLGGRVLSPEELDASNGRSISYDYFDSGLRQSEGFDDASSPAAGSDWDHSIETPAEDDKVQLQSGMNTEFKLGREISLPSSDPTPLPP